MEKETFETTLTSKGQIVIGSRIRKKLGLKPQQKLVGRIQKNKIIIEPVETPIELGGSLRKMAKGRTTEELMKEIKSGWE